MELVIGCEVCFGFIFLREGRLVMLRELVFNSQLLGHDSNLWHVSCLVVFRFCIIFGKLGIGAVLIRF